MKRLICATLALSLLGATAASAQPYHRGGGHHASERGCRPAAATHGRGIGIAWTAIERSWTPSFESRVSGPMTPRPRPKLPSAATSLPCVLSTAPSSSQVQDTRFSSWEQGFESPWGHSSRRTIEDARLSSLRIGRIGSEATPPLDASGIRRCQRVPALKPSLESPACRAFSASGWSCSRLYRA